MQPRRDPNGDVYIYIYTYVYNTYVYIYIYICIIYICIYIYIYISVGISPRLHAATSPLEGTKGVPRNGGRKQQLVLLFLLSILHMR